MTPNLQQDHDEAARKEMKHKNHLLTLGANHHRHEWQVRNVLHRRGKGAQQRLLSVEVAIQLGHRQLMVHSWLTDWRWRRLGRLSPQDAVVLMHEGIDRHVTEEVVHLLVDVLNRLDVIVVS